MMPECDHDHCTNVATGVVEVGGERYWTCDTHRQTFLDDDR